MPPGFSCFDKHNSLIILSHKIIFRTRYSFPAPYIRAKWQRILGMEVGKRHGGGGDQIPSRQVGNLAGRFPYSKSQTGATSFRTKPVPDDVTGDQMV
jgi:hypothetical protein